MKIFYTALLSLAFCFSANAQNSQPERDWNFLIFLNGVNSLDDFGPVNIKQMEQLGSTDKMNILVQWGSEKAPDVTRLLVKKSTDPSNVTSPAVQNLGAVDMGDPKSLVNFAKWAQDNYPAKHTFLVVWNHGGGWHLKGNSFGIKDISWDDKTGHHISTEQLGAAMKEIATSLGHKIDIYGSDACLMGMAEVSREMSESVEYFVGSQDLEPGYGWPYSDFLGHWQNNMNMSSADVATTLAKDYSASYSGGSYGNDAATLSVFNLKAQADFDSSMSQLAQQLLSLKDTQLTDLKTASGASKAFYTSDYKDLIDFLDRSSLDRMVPQATSDVRAAYAKYVIANAQNEDVKTHGLSIWMPSNESEVNTYLARYRGLKFNQATGWGDVVAKIFGK